jgi:hypothetical protein
VLRIRITMMRIWILLFTLMWDPDPTFHSDADPDPTTYFFPAMDPPMLKHDPLRLPIHFDADPEQDSAFHFDTAAIPVPASPNDEDPSAPDPHY